MKYLILITALLLSTSQILATPLLYDSDLSQKDLQLFLYKETDFRITALKKHAGFHRFELRRVRTDLVRFSTNAQVEEEYKTFELDLFENESFNIKFKRLFNQLNGIISWVGHVEGDHHSLAVLTERDGHMAGEIHTFGKVFSIKPIAKEWIAIRELKSELIQSQADDQIIVEQHQSDAHPSDLHTSSLENDGRVIDVYVFFNDEAFAGSSDIVTEISNDMAFTNAALDSSCTETYLRLLGTQQITFAESGQIQDDTEAFADRYDGNIDSIHDTLDAQGADLAQLWVENVSTGFDGSSTVSACGAGITSLPFPGNAPVFSIKVRPCSSYATAHEFGHNFTVLHDRFQCYGTQLQANYPQETGWGFVNLNEKIRDIMSYDTECNVHGFSCTRLPYFSNPRIFLNGQPFGITTQADAATQIIRNKIHIARIHGAKTTPSEPTFSLCAETTANSLKIDKCFIATAAYGSFLDPHVTQFRQFRDHFLSQTKWGRKWIDLYYRYSPGWAQLLRDHAWLKPLARAILGFILVGIEHPWLVAAMFLLLLLLIAHLMQPISFRRGARTNSLLALALLTLSLLHPFDLEASYHNPSLFRHNLHNPSSLPLMESSHSLALDTSNYSRTYKTANRDINTSQTNFASTLSYVMYSPYFSLGLEATLPATEKFSRTMALGNVDEWEVSHQSYKFMGSFGLENLLFGLGVVDKRDTLVRDAITTDWNVVSTTHIEEELLGLFGGRLTVYKPLSIGGLIEYGQRTSTDAATANVTKFSGSFGFSSNDKDMPLKKADLTYIFVPESIFSESDPMGPTWNSKKNGYDLDVEVGFDLDMLLKSINLGAEYETLTYKGLNGEGDTATETNLYLRLGMGFLNNLLTVKVESLQRSIRYSVTEETAQSLHLLAAYLF